MFGFAPNVEAILRIAGILIGYIVDQPRLLEGNGVISVPGEDIESTRLATLPTVDCEVGTSAGFEKYPATRSARI